MSRPEILFPLFAGLETLEGIGPKTAIAFAALGVSKPKDLLFLLPHSGVDRARKASVRGQPRNAAAKTTNPWA